MNKIANLFLALSFLMLANCEKADPECFLSEPSITVNGEIPENDAVSLEVLNNGNIQLNISGFDDFNCQWTGPNGFLSNISNPVISNVTEAMSGNYKVVVSKGICSSEKTVSVAIDAPVITCTPQNNRLTFSGPVSLNPVNFTYILAYTSLDIFRINASGTGGDLTISFANGTPPQTGVYTVSSDCPSTPGSIQVCLSMVYSNNYCSASEGQVFITRQDNGKYIAVFCNIKFNPSNSLPFELIASTQITQP